MGLNTAGTIEKINGKMLNYKEFEKYLQTNKPVLLTGLMDGWRACKDWVNEDGSPNLHFFFDNFGKSQVQVADCNRRDFTDQKRVTMSVSDFIIHWLEDSKKRSNPEYHETNGQSLLYLKDWHFVKEYPDYVAYTTPSFFLDDWLNLYLDNYRIHMDVQNNQYTNEINCSDYRFVYMGAKGTWTPLHADVFRSYSWSANVCGRKKWLFLSPSQSHLVFDRNMKNSVYNIFDDVSEVQFPNFKKAIWLECSQEQNEIIFVPSGWYHQVHNLEDTISINHNWFNGHNLSWVWRLLVKDYNEAKGYIEDVQDISENFEGLCQRNLAANTGMNFIDFSFLIAQFCVANLIQLFHHLSKEDLSWDPSRKDQNLIRNLISIRQVASSMKQADAFSPKYPGGCFDISFLSDIRDIILLPKFLTFCNNLGVAYEIIEDLCDQNVEALQQFCLKDNVEIGDSTFDQFYNILTVDSCDAASSHPGFLVKIIDRALKFMSERSGYFDSLSSESEELEKMAIF